MNQPRNLLLESLAAIERLQARVAELEARGREPIAIVGAGCRFPGAGDPQALWELLRDRRDMVRDVPSDRWDPSRHTEGGKAIPQRGGFLNGLDQFDASFFGISAREAVSLDPQQRLLLETAQEAFESAGIATDRLLRSRTGVFVGISTTDYQQLMLGNGLEGVDIYAANGGALNTAAGRLAFVFGLEGPAMAVDTACSSSLVAVHLAVQSLRRRETDLALASGVNVVLQPAGMVLFSQWGLMAPDGACKTFDDMADGFVRAEGCGTIVLKRLSDALAADDPILAVIRGTATNSDGRSSGLTVPHGPSQEAVIRAALDDSGLAPGDIDYIEAHGTGTSLGDPIEMEAIGAVMSAGHGPDNPLIVGAVKPNIGHGEASAGMAGLLKIVTALQNEAIPPNIHFSKPSLRIDWESLPVRVPTDIAPWPRHQNRVRRAGVSGFGFSGTNAHVVIEEAPPRQSPRSGSGRLGLALLSARTPHALSALAGRVAGHLASQPQMRVADVLTSLASGRAHGARRVAFPASSLGELRRGLESVAAGALPANATEGAVRPGEPPRVAFLFTGQGAQYPGMGRELYECEAVFRASIDRCAELLTGTLDVDLRELLFKEGPTAPNLALTGYTQPALFAFEYALAELWRSFGIAPSIVAGHSIGEYVAACVAGVFSLEDGLRLTAARGRLMQELPAGGAMAAIFAAESDVRAIVRGLDGPIAIAAVNGPGETVVSGDGPSVAEVLEICRSRSIEARRLDVSHAFHSPLLEPMLDHFERVASEIPFAAPRIPLVSNLTGQLFKPGARPDANYWRRHAREAVRFSDVLQAMASNSAGVLLEIGPQPTLVGIAERTLPAARWACVGSLRRGQSDQREINRALRDLYVAGAELDWSKVASGWGGQRIALPASPFQREHHWTEKRTERALPAGAHSLLGPRIDLALAPGNHVWETDIDLEHHAWIDDHRVQGSAIVPATAYIEMALAAAEEVVGPGIVSVRDYTNLKPLVLASGTRYRIQTSLTSDKDGYLFAVYARDAGAGSGSAPSWLQLVSAVVSIAEPRTARMTLPDDIRSITSIAEPMERSEFYARTAALGNEWRSAFQGLEHVWQREGEALAEITVRPELEKTIGRFRFHPAVSDACGHSLVAITSLAAADRAGGAFVGGGVDEIRFHRSPPPGRLWAHARLRPGAQASNDLADGHVVIGDVDVYAEDGALVSETIGARLWYLDETVASTPAANQILYETIWETRALDGSRSRGCVDGAWIVIGGPPGLASEIADVCREMDRRCVIAEAGTTFSVSSASATLSFNQPDDHVALLRAVGPCAAIVDLRGIEAGEADAAEEALHLLHAVTASPDHASTRIWLVTAGTQAADAETVQTISGASLWGLGRSISLEHPDQFGGLLDLDPAASLGVSARFVAREVAEADDEDMVAFRGTQRRVPRLVRLDRADRSVAPFAPHADATYVITGGLGGIGLAVASWLAANGARHLLLVGRTPLPQPPLSSAPDLDERIRRRLDAVSALETLGVGIEIATGDVADARFLTNVLEARRRRGDPPVVGAFHLAGSVAFTPLTDETPTGLDAMNSAKLRGALALERALEPEPVEHFVLFSSTSALLRSPLLGAYAGANAALDALASRRVHRNLPALSVNWGTWGEAGMAVDAARAGRGAMLAGVDVLPTATALDALGNLMGRRSVHAAVMPVDWSALAAAYPRFAADPFLSSLTDAGKCASTAQRSGLTGRELLATPEAEQHHILLAYLQIEAARALGTAPDRLDVTEPLSARGLDSLMAVQMKTRVETDLGVSLPMMSVLRGPSVDDLAGIVLALVRTTEGQGGSERGDIAVEHEWEEGSL